MLNSIRSALSGKKVYLLLVAGVLGIVQQWASGELTDMQALQAVWALGLGGAFRSALGKIGIG